MLNPNFQVGQRYGRWVFEGPLGSGSFGQIMLWKNETSNEEIVIKMLKCTASAEAAHRWKEEVSLLQSLAHENIVAGLGLPEDLNCLTEANRVLAMEFCSGGDLRQLFKEQRNVCGLCEDDVLAVWFDISQGLRYLHDHNIIHRDLKPENVVISLSAISSERRFKLIDLGYAKVTNSHADSLVGTHFYQAPEQLRRHKYTHTVDYWSFGLTLFECCVGYRPFFSSTDPLCWFNTLEQQKRAEHIFARYTGIEGQEVDFSDKIPAPNQLSEVVRTHLERFLRMMLRMRAKLRGFDVIQGTQVSWFDLVEQLFHRRFVRIFYVTNRRSYVVPVDDVVSINFRQVQENIKRATSVSSGDQVLITKDGETLRGFTIVDQIATSLRHQTASNRIYLLAPVTSAFHEPLPEEVQAVIDDVTMLSFDKVNVCAKCMHVCWRHSNEIAALVMAKSAVLNCARLQTELLKAKLHELVAKQRVFEEVVRFAKRSLLFDIKKYDVQSLTKDGFVSDEMMNEWQGDLEDLTAFENRSENFDSITAKVDSLVRELKQLYKNLDSGASEEEAAKLALEECLSTVSEVYNLARAKSRKRSSSSDDDEYARPFRPIELKNAIIDSRDIRSEAVDSLVSNMNNITDKCVRIDSLGLSVLARHLKSLNKKQDKVYYKQEKRQKALWWVLKSSSSMTRVSDVMPKEKTRHMSVPSGMRTTVVASPPSLSSSVSLPTTSADPSPEQQQQGAACATRRKKKKRRSGDETPQKFEW